MSAPSLRCITQTPQREFAGAKVLKINDICKKNLRFYKYICIYEKKAVPLQRILIENSQLYCGFLIKIRKCSTDIYV